MYETPTGSFSRTSNQETVPKFLQCCFFVTCFSLTLGLDIPTMSIPQTVNRWRALCHLKSVLKMGIKKNNKSNLYCLLKIYRIRNNLKCLEQYFILFWYYETTAMVKRIFSNDTHAPTKAWRFQAWCVMYESDKPMSCTC